MTRGLNARACIDMSALRCSVISEVQVSAVACTAPLLCSEMLWGMV